MSNNKKRINPTAFSQSQEERNDPVFAFVVLEAEDGRIGLSEVTAGDKKAFKIDTVEDQLRVKRDCLVLIEMIDRQILRSTIMQAFSDTMTQQLKKFKPSGVVDFMGRPIIKPKEGE